MYWSKIVDKFENIKSCTAHITQIDIEDIFEENNKGVYKVKELVKNTLLSENFKFDFQVDDEMFWLCLAFKSYYKNVLKNIQVRFSQSIAGRTTVYVYIKTSPDSDVYKLQLDNISDRLVYEMIDFLKEVQ